MSFPLEQRVAFDTNIFLFAIRDPIRQSCHQVITTILPRLSLFIPFQVQLELRRNLNDAARRDVFAIIAEARQSHYEYEQPSPDHIAHWQSRGAKKGDAVICAALEAADVKFLVSENRHFLQEIESLPFEVLSAQLFMNRMKS